LRADWTSHGVSPIISAFASVADPVSLLLVRLAADEGGDQLVPTLADVSVYSPDRQHDPVTPEGPVPRERVLVVRVDQRAVDIQQDGTRHGLGRRRLGVDRLLGLLRGFLVRAFGELLDDLRVESRQIVGFAARDQTRVDDDLLVDPVRARVD
jgi:hypothetical protein